MKKNISKIHKYLALIAIIPTFLWCLSGLLHPVMVHFFKDIITNEKYINPPINKSKLKVKPEIILNNYSISKFQDLKIITINQSQWYQVKYNDSIIRYFETTSGKELKNGDKFYAIYLANKYLNLSNRNPISITKLNNFTSTYKFVNRYLPVYQIEFNNPKSIIIYINTIESKLSTVNTTLKETFILVFDLFHNWSFLNFLPKNIQVFTLLVLLGFIGISSISGLVYYSLFYKQFKKTNKLNNKLIKERKSHRNYGLYFSVFSLTFCFSGGYHLIHKYNKTKENTFFNQEIFTSSLNTDFSKIPFDFNKLSLITIDENLIWRSTKMDKNNQEVIKYFDCKKTPLNYYSDSKVAQFYFEKITKRTDFKSMSYLTEFDKKEYGFINKRLPVYKITTKNNERYFIDTQAALIASHLKQNDKIEGISFAILHKFMFLDFLGKPMRDLIISIIIIGLIITTYKGIKLMFK